MRLANPEQGETSVVIGGRPYVLVMTFNGLIALQQTFQKEGKLPAVESILLAAQAGDLEAFRAVFWATLRRHHSDIGLVEAGDLIDAAGGVEALNRLLTDVHANSGPDPRDEAALRGRNPRRPGQKVNRQKPTGAH